MRNKISHGHFNAMTSIIAKGLSIMPKFVIKNIYNIFKNTGGYLGLGIRYVCVRNLAKKCGDNVALFPNIVIKHIESLELGNNVSIHPYCYIDAIGGLNIGDNVSIANHCSLISFGHTWDDERQPIKYNPLIMTPINIASDVWIGCGSRIIGPCNIDSRTIIAAGAVVKGNLSGMAIYGGVPARMIKQLLNISNSPSKLGGGKQLICSALISRSNGVKISRYSRCA